jgi:XTP/dITP diphosphohydrolase
VHLDFTFKGTVSGVITTERQGEHGFGYDPIFYVPEKGKTPNKHSIS